MSSTIPRVKICCIGSREEAWTAIGAGASALGLVAAMPSGPGPIPDETIAEIARIVPPPIGTFLLTSRTKARDIIAHQRKVHTNTIQIVDELTEGTYDDIKRALPDVRLVQVIHVIDEMSVNNALHISVFVDAILLYSGNPRLPTKELGGTGRIHNWELSRKIRENITKPVFLAGGLHSGNVRQAINIVRPFGVDVCSGVRTNGLLDRNKLEQFFDAVHTM